MTPRDSDRGEPVWRRYVRFWGRDVRADVRDEIDFHVEGLVEELRGAGMSDADARRAAAERFGDSDRIARAMRDLAERRERGAQRAGWLRGVGQDLVYALRSLRRSPLAAATAVATLAVGLGASAAVFSLVDRLFWRPPDGVERPGEVRRVWTSELQRWDGRRPTLPALSYPRYEILAAAFAGRAEFGLYMADTMVRLGDGPRGPKVHLTLANRDYFRVLGARIAAGRMWDEGEDLVRAGSPVAVVSARFAERHLSGGAGAVGSRIQLGGRPFTVVGVTDPSFGGVDLQPADVWVPLGDYGARRTMPGLRVWWERPVFPTLRAVVRLAPGVDEAALAAVGTSRLRESQATLLRGTGDSLVSMTFGSIVGVRGPGAVAAEVSIASRLAMLVGVMLVIACANVANLLLARATERRRELAVRVAIGASRMRLLRLLTVESVLLALPAGVLAALAAWWAGGLLRSLLLPDIAWAGSPLHWRVALFAMGAAFAASWVAGIVPAVQAARTDPSEALRSGGRSSTAARSRTRFVLTATQLALSVALLAAAGAFIASLQRVRGLDLGVDVERVVVASADYDDRLSAPPDAVVAGALGEIASAVRRMPGVEEAALAITRPLSDSWVIMNYYSGSDSLRMSENSNDWAALFMVTPEYFRVMGMRFVRGGPFEAGSHAGAVVVNETMARMLWPGREAVGQCIQLERRTSPCLPVTGVVADARRSKVIESPRPQYFVSADLKARDGWGPSALVVRVAPEQRPAVMAALREELTRAFPEAAPNVESLEQTLAPQLRPWALGAELFTVLAALALVLSIVGVYANVAYQVGQRTRELAVRIALGARVGDVLRVVALTGLRPVVAGTLAGLLLALGTGRLIAALLFEASPHDPVLLSAIAVMLVAVSAVAMAGPARRAVRMDPVTVLRDE